MLTCGFVRSKTAYVRQKLSTGDGLAACRCRAASGLVLGDLSRTRAVRTNGASVRSVVETIVRDWPCEGDIQERGKEGMDQRKQPTKKRGLCSWTTRTEAKKKRKERRGQNSLIFCSAQKFPLDGSPALPPNFLELLPRRPKGAHVILWHRWVPELRDIPAH